MQTYDPRAPEPCSDCLHHGTGGASAIDPAACMNCQAGSEYIPARSCINCGYAQTHERRPPCANCHAFDSWTAYQAKQPEPQLSPFAAWLNEHFLDSRDTRDRHNPDTYSYEWWDGYHRAIKDAEEAYRNRTDQTEETPQ